MKKSVRNILLLIIGIGLVFLLGELFILIGINSINAYATAGIFVGMLIPAILTRIKNKERYKKYFENEDSKSKN